MNKILRRLMFWRRRTLEFQDLFSLTVSDGEFKQQLQKLPIDKRKEHFDKMVQAAGMSLLMAMSVMGAENFITCTYECEGKRYKMSINRIKEEDNEPANN